MNNEEPLNCSICKQVFANAEGLLNHMHSHDAEDFVPCNVASNEHLNFESLNEEGEPLQCSICSQVFANETILRLHMMLHDQEGNSLSFVTCDKGFVSSEASNEHLKSESFNNEGEPVKCSVCSQVFANTQGLQVHMWSHAKSFPLSNTDTLVCGKCNEDVGTIENLQKHKCIYDEDPDREEKLGFLSGPFFFTGKDYEQHINGGNSSEVVDWGNSSEAIEGGNSSEAIEGENSSKAVDGGNSPKAIDWGNSSKAVDGGNSSKTVDWGNIFKAVDGGNSSEAIEGGNSSEVLDWGNSSEVVDWGNCFEVINWGNSSKAVDCGNSSKAVDGGNSSKAVDWGNSSKAVDGGNSSKAIDWGNIFKAVDGGNSSKAEDEGMEAIERLENFQWFYNEDSDMEEEFSFVSGLVFSEGEDSENPPLAEIQENADVEDFSLQHADGGDSSEADEEEGEHFPCHLCPLVFDTLEELATHLKSDPFHKEGEMHPCTLCSEEFATKASLNNHMWVHNEGFPLFNIDKYICPKCYEEMEYENKEKHKCVPNDDSDDDMLEEYVVRGPGPV